MGSNMQRQAVPLLVPRRARWWARASKNAWPGIPAPWKSARRGGVVLSAASDHVAVYSRRRERRRRPLSICANTRAPTKTPASTKCPASSSLNKVKKGDVLADGPATQDGELALGRNLLVAFMPWEGYNFEDAIFLSERLVRDDVFTSIHISEFQVEARDTKMGAEEITKDIPERRAPNPWPIWTRRASFASGAEVAPGDILVGKVAPKGDQQTTPEERLLKVIFGKKAEDVMDASLRVPPGITGKIIGHESFRPQRKTSAKKDENKQIERNRSDELEEQH
ncbi:MAG: hypothetical protein V9E92_10860 [Methylotenera sp.]